MADMEGAERMIFGPVNLWNFPLQNRDYMNYTEERRRSNALKLRPIRKPTKAQQPVMTVTIEPHKDVRTLSQNAAQWPILTAFANQLLWPVNGQMVKMDADEWKDVLTAAFKQETVRLAMGLNGGVVMLGKRTSKFKKDEFAEWMEFLNSVAVDRGVKVPMSKKQAAMYE